jgi:hypothetical protein
MMMVSPAIAISITPAQPVIGLKPSLERDDTECQCLGGAGTANARGPHRPIPAIAFHHRRVNHAPGETAKITGATHGLYIQNACVLISMSQRTAADAGDQSKECQTRFAAAVRLTGRRSGAKIAVPARSSTGGNTAGTTAALADNFCFPRSGMSGSDPAERCKQDATSDIEAGIFAGL